MFNADRRDTATQGRQPGSDTARFHTEVIDRPLPQMLSDCKRIRRPSKLSERLKGQSAMAEFIAAQEQAVAAPLHSPPRSHARQEHEDVPALEDGVYKHKREAG